VNRTTAIWFGVAGVLILSFGFLYQVVDPAYYEATSIVDLALVFLQAVVAVVVGIALILLWRDPPVSRGSLFLLFAGVGAIAIGVGGLLEDGFGIEDAVWVWFGGGLTMFASLPIAGVAALTVRSPLRWSGLFLIVAAPGYYGFFALTMGLSWILFGLWIVYRKQALVYALAALIVPALVAVGYLYGGDVL
jgi:hypothetical protein